MKICRVKHEMLTEWSLLTKEGEDNAKIIKGIKIGKVFLLLSSTGHWTNSWSSLYGQKVMPIQLYF